jgi:hypothetical protein
MPRTPAPHAGECAITFEGHGPFRRKFELAMRELMPDDGSWHQVRDAAILTVTGVRFGLRSSFGAASGSLVSI